MDNERFLAGIPEEERPDAVYFLMIAGWRQQLRANRWHWAKRWSRHVPVVLVQPETGGLEFDARTEDEPRIPNTRILSMRMIAREREKLVPFGALQTAQIMADVYRAGYRNPWLWLYSPMMAVPYALLPFRKKIMHLTEDWFLRPDWHGLQHRETRAELRTSNLVIAVSEGCAASAREQVPGIDPLVVTNGCDYRDYSSGREDAELLTKAEGYDRIAAFGGNLHDGIDYDLLGRAVRENPRTFFVMAGPFHDLPSEQEAARAAVMARENTWFPGRVEAERLADFYHTAHLGFIPFTTDELYSKSAFSLKLLEMAAAGLPVVTTWMESIAGLGAEAIRVTRTREEFLRRFREADRRRLPDAVRGELDRLARANDYDVKFRRVMEEVERRHGSAFGEHGLGPQIREGLLDEGTARELQAFVTEYARRPRRESRRPAPPDGRIAVPILSVRNRLGAELLEQRRRVESAAERTRRRAATSTVSGAGKSMQNGQ